jgi:Flp pilus assembly protein TadG
MRDDRGSAPAEFVMVGALLVVLALSVIQLALALHVRTTVLDAAAEGARTAALAGATRADGVERTRDLITSGTRS